MFTINNQQLFSHIVESCLLTKLNGGLSQPHSADDAAIAWLTNYARRRPHSSLSTGLPGHVLQARCNVTDQSHDHVT